MLEAYQLLHDGAITLSAVERQGICIDVPYCIDKLAWLDFKIFQATRRLDRTELGALWRKVYGENVNYESGNQLRAILYSELKVKPFKNTQSNDDGSVDEESLRQVNVEGIDYLLQNRRYGKMRDFLSGFMRYQVNGVLHPSFLLHTVSTYRSSCADPNMQNVPKRDKEAMEVCRRAIIPRKGHGILEIDFKSIEVGVGTCYHKDPTMLNYLFDPKTDMHGDMANQIYMLPKFDKKPDGFSDLRGSAKNGFVFPQFYGDYYEPCAFNMGFQWCKLPKIGEWKDTDGINYNGAPIGKLMRGNGIKSLEDFAKHIKKVEDDFWNNRFRVYNTWRKRWYEQYKRNGYFDTLTGFRCSGLMQRNQVTNYPVQGSAFHCLLKSLIEIVGRLKGWRSAVIGEIHDSVLIDYHPDEFDEVVALCKQVCEVWLPQQWKWIIVPMKVEISVALPGQSWADIKELK